MISKFAPSVGSPGTPRAPAARPRLPSTSLEATTATADTLAIQLQLSRSHYSYSRHHINTASAVQGKCSVVKMARLVGLVVGLVVAVRGQEEGTTNLVSLRVPTHQVESTEANCVQSSLF